MVDTPLLPTLVSSLQILVVEGIMEDTIAVVAVVEASWTLNTVSKDK